MLNSKLRSEINVSTLATSIHDIVLEVLERIISQKKEGKGILIRRVKLYLFEHNIILYVENSIEFTKKKTY